MGKGPEYTFFQRGHTNGQQICEKLKSLIIKEIQIKTTSDITSQLLD